MKILVSACLLGVNCKYNGGNNYQSVLKKLMKEHQLIPVCPESYGGLSVPREPAERVGERVVSRSGEDMTTQFLRGSHAMVQIADFFGCELAILKENSPSCGYGMIYDGTFSGTRVPGDGVFAEMLRKKEIPVIGESEIKNYFNL